MEIVAALQRKIRVIPVLVGGARMPGRQDLPGALAPLSRRNAIELSETRFHADVNRLIEAIEKSFTVAEEKTEISATPTTPVKSTQTTPVTPPVPSTSSNAALKEPKVWARKRLIMIGAIGTIVILLALAGFLMWPNRQKAARQTNQSAIASLQKPIVSIATPVKSTQTTPATFAVPLTSSNFANGVLYDVSKDLDTARKERERYQKAADQGNPAGQYYLALIYQHGWGVPKDSEKAAELYQKSADQGLARPQTNLGMLYQNGEGVPKDLEKARELLQKAASQGFKPAIENLSRYQN